MHKIFVIIAVVIIMLSLSGCENPKQNDNFSLKDACEGRFLIGVALNTQQVGGTDSLAQSVIKKHFNSVVAENCMKSEKIQPEQGIFTFEDADKFVAYGEANNMFIIGHCLVWHSQVPAWFFVDKNGNDVSRDTLIARMKNHIQTLVGRYKGRVDGWDVVNEAFEDDGSYRQSKFYKIIGEDYINLAFQFAREADPDAELYYNDYNMAKSAKRDAVYEMIKALQYQGIKVDGIGFQAHLTMDFPEVKDMENSIVKLSELGKIMITEMDLTVLPWPSDQVTADVSFRMENDPKYNPYPNGLTEDASKEWTNRMMDFFTVFLKHHDKISRVTVWGVSDNQTWRNNWPIEGRKDYPLLFDRQYEPKPVVDEIIKIAEGTN